MRKAIDVTGATLPFYMYEVNGKRFFEFDSSMSSPPEPMVNALCGLNLLQNQNDVLVMTNTQEPLPLYARIEKDFQWKVEVLPSDDVKIFFSRRV